MIDKCCITFCWIRLARIIVETIFLCNNTHSIDRIILCFLQATRHIMYLVKYFDWRPRNEERREGKMRSSLSVRGEGENWGSSGGRAYSKRPAMLVNNAIEAEDVDRLVMTQVPSVRLPAPSYDGLSHVATIQAIYEARVVLDPGADVDTGGMGGGSPPPNPPEFHTSRKNPPPQPQKGKSKRRKIRQQPPEP